MNARRGASMALAAVAALLSQSVIAADATNEALLTRAVALEAESRIGTAIDDGIHIYVGNSVPDWELIEVELHLEGLPARRYAYSPAEGRALVGGGLHRLASLSADTSPRNGQLDFFIRERNSGRAVKPVRGRLMLALTPGVTQYLVELRDRTLGHPELTWTATPSRVDGELRYADFLDASSHPARAAFVRAAYGAGYITATAPAVEAARVAPLNIALAAATPVALQPLAELEAQDSLGWALRDRANLRLGYLQLRAGAPAEAALAFRRVRSPGPNANAALLGYGWARLIPASAPNAATMYLATTPLRPGDDDAVAAARRTTPFRYVDAVAHENRAGDLRKALVPWGELIGRDPTDPAVQEGLLALAYAHGHLGAHAQANQYFARAVAQLESLIGHYAAAERDVANDGLARLWTQTANADNGWPGWMAAMPEPRWWLTDPPNAPATFYFDRLIANPDFLRDLDALLAVRELQELLAQQAQKLQGAAAPQLAVENSQLRKDSERLASRYQSALRQRAVEQLRGQRQVAEQYLVEASFALARMVDMPEAFAEGAVQ
ncbi:MAG TPA: hypothetical protein VGE51_10505 [Fontimonas sp.]